MSAGLPESALRPIRAHFAAAPSRTWSLIMSLFGDAVLPRGGTVWLGTLADFLALLDVGENAVRTAMSRLAADGWLTRIRNGRNSYYRLTAEGERETRSASGRIYATRAQEGPGRFDMVLTDGGAPREALRDGLRAAGFGMIASDLWIAPHGTPIPAIASGALCFSADTDAPTLAKLVARGWPLDDLAAAYGRFLATYAPLHEILAGGATPTPEQAILARVLMIHDYRRIVLRDPALPAVVLPADWPGTAARTLCATVYPRLIAASEAWLDAHASGEDGAPLPPAIGLDRRFTHSPPSPRP